MYNCCKFVVLHNNVGFEWLVDCSQFAVLTDCVDNVVFHRTVIAVQLTESVAPNWFYVDLGGISLLTFVN